MDKETQWILYDEDTGEVIAELGPDFNGDFFVESDDNADTSTQKTSDN